MAFQAYVKIKGTKQGQFKGDGVQRAGHDAITVLRFVSGATAPRDVATGQASGKRQWQPIRITKEWGAASPQLLLALTTNEVLPSVVFEFYRTDKAGKEQLHYRITLHDAIVSSITSVLDLTASSGANAPYAGHELEDVEFTFRSIMVEDLADKMTASDNWHDVAQPSQPMTREPVRPVSLPAG
jgi:type VI secretion system secreted protein Hcp